MKKVVNVNLSGNAYQLEEEGFDRLTDYLEDARSQLHGNLDIDEIMADLEQSIADKINRFLNAKKTVVTSAEVEQIVTEMGPVEAAFGDGAAPEAADSQSSTRTEQPDEALYARKLYKLSRGDEKMLTGVCAGIAAYLGIDVSIVRIVFIALAFASAGLMILFYLVLALIIPAAKTPQQQAAAYGAPFDAREVIDRAKSKFGDIRDGKEWKSQQRYWNRHARNAGFDGVGSILGLVVVLFGILIGLYLLHGLFFGLGTPMVVGPGFSRGFPWWSIVLMVIIAVFVIGWVLGEGRTDDRSQLGSALHKTAQVLLILLIIYIVFRILF